MKRWIIFTLCALMLFALGCTEIKTPEKAAEPTPAPANEPASEPEPSPEQGSEPAWRTEVGDLSFDTVTFDGEPMKAGMIEGYDLVVVNCWAEWCGPCVGELPELERIHREYPNVLLIGLLSFSNNREDAKKIIAESGVTYPVFEPNGSLVRLVDRFDAIPTTMFFDKDGHEITEPVVGSRSYEEWKAIIEELLP